MTSYPVLTPSRHRRVPAYDRAVVRRSRKIGRRAGGGDGGGQRDFPRRAARSRPMTIPTREDHVRSRRHRDRASAVEAARWHRARAGRGQGTRGRLAELDRRRTTHLTVNDRHDRRCRGGRDRGRGADAVGRVAVRKLCEAESQTARPKPRFSCRELVEAAKLSDAIMAHISRSRLRTSRRCSSSPILPSGWRWRTRSWRANSASCRSKRR